MAIRSIDANAGTVRISVNDDLTPNDLGLIGNALRATGRGGHVEVDLRAARHVSPQHLVELARLFADLGATYDLSGLSSSNHRLLKLLGVSTEGSRPNTDGSRLRARAGAGDAGDLDDDR